MTALRDIVVSGGANSVMFERLIKVPLDDDDSAAKFAISNARKDLRYYTSIAEQLPVAAFLAEAVHQTYVLADNLGYGAPLRSAAHRCAGVGERYREVARGIVIFRT